MDIYRNRRKGVSALTVILLMLAAAAFAGGGVYLWQNSSARSQALENKNLNEALVNVKSERDTLQSKVNELDKDVQALKDAAARPAQKDTAKSVRENVQSRADEVLHALKDRDMVKLAAYVHPDKGVRFSPYSYINTKSDVTIPAAQIPNLMTDTVKRTWGAYDGTGDPISLTFKDYYEKFIYDKDFLNAPQLVFNQPIQRGNSLNNITDAYPGAAFVEYYFPGFEKKYNGMDWRSLTLVFEEKGGIWYLTGVIHNQWTI